MPPQLLEPFQSLWESADSPPDVFAFLDEHPHAQPEEQLAVLRLDQQRRWKTDQPIGVEDYLAQLPALAADPHGKLELAVGEFQARQNGESSPSLEEFLSRFADVSDTLREKLSAFESTQNAQQPSLSPTETFDFTEIYQRIGRYRLYQVLGEGAFGRVWLGFDEELEREVAIKVPKPERFQSGEDTELYLTEARTVAGLNHPNIVPVFDMGRSKDGDVYVVSKLIEGCTLGDLIQRDRPTFDYAAKLLAIVAQALQHAHQMRLIHRDIKPANILIEEATNTPYVADFGLAIKEEDYVESGRSAGTPAYMSPEQARGEGHRLDGRSDIFSLGIVFYELLTGKRPFRGSSAYELMVQISTTEPLPPRERDAEIPAELERICLKSLSKRVSDRYATAADLADDLLHWNDTPQQQHKERQIVPKGLRSFDAEDADFFLDLLPGPRNREGLPESISFWKTRIEETDPDNTFAVGLIYGPSGCGKSSLVKAGLLPRLSKDVVAVYVEATPDEAETRILRGLRKGLANLPADLDLVETFTFLRRGEGKKVVIVLDQFEQWLHTHQAEQDTKLVNALRQCDGSHLQAVVMVRDDFWLAASRFMSSVEVQLLQGQNIALVDLFDEDHSKKALLKFGQAFGKLPSQAGELSDEEKNFVSVAVEGLAQDGKVVSVQLALFAEMVKDKPWTTLEGVGGTEGIGVNFLEENFAARTANPKQRQHQAAAREILSCLLPDVGMDIRGHMQTHAELLEASGYKNRLKEFTELLRILDSELRLITPTNPAGFESDSDSDPDTKYYQLTHDYLVPSLREWLTRKQLETKKGRAELRLAERSALWNAKPESRQLPSLVEWLRIRRLTEKPKWTVSECQMMNQAGRFHAVRSSLILLFVCVLTGVGLHIRERVVTKQNDDRATGLVTALVSADIELIPGIIEELDDYREWANPKLAAELKKHNAQSKERLHISLALLPSDPHQLDYLVNRLLSSEPEQVETIRIALAPHKEEIDDHLWAVLGEANTANRTGILQAASALSLYAPNSEKWKTAYSPAFDAFNSLNAVYFNDWLSLLTPTIFEHELARKPEPTWDENQKDMLALRQANAAIALLKMGETDQMWGHLKHSSDPRLRTWIIHRLSPMGARLKVIVERLKKEPNVSVRRALILALGEHEDSKSVDREALTLLLLDWYQSDPDAGIHGATEWVLRQWGKQNEIATIDKALQQSEHSRDKKNHKREWYLNTQGQTYVILKADEFLMGSPLSEVQRDSDDHVLHMHKIGRRFAISSKEVTQAQWRVFLKAHPNMPPNSHEATKTEDSPIGTISWFQAVQYCNWLSKQEGIAEEQWCYEPNVQGDYTEGMKVKGRFWELSGYRLPTEAEWEFACRSGSVTSRYYGQSTDLLAKYAWYHTNSENETWPVASLKPNDFGLFDMHGNVYEWCQNTLEDDQSTDNRSGFDATTSETIRKFGRRRVLRSGAYNYPTSYIRSAIRVSNWPKDRAVSFGFRPTKTYN